MKENLPIGIFDSGIGGLTVLKALQEKLPNESFIYLGDTARLPYGTKGEHTIVRYAHQAAEMLIKKGIKMLIIACNTATAYAMQDLTKSFPNLPILGVIEPGATAASRATKTKNIIVLATEATIKIDAYKNAIQQINPEIQVQSQACSLFVALAEEGWLTGDITEAIIKKYISPLLEQTRPAPPDCIVLGCTHFPALRASIHQVVGSHIAIVDSAETTANAAHKILTELNLTTQLSAPKYQFYATDVPERFAKTAKFFLGKRLDANQIKMIDL